MSGGEGVGRGESREGLDRARTLQTEPLTRFHHHTSKSSGEFPGNVSGQSSVPGGPGVGVRAAPHTRTQPSALDSRGRSQEKPTVFFLFFFFKFNIVYTIQPNLVIRGPVLRTA